MILYLFITLIVITPPIAGNNEPTKLCSNDDCSEKLFTALATRDYPKTHDDFIDLKVNDTITVYAIKMSNRVDLGEGVNSAGERGRFFLNHIDKESFYFFLFSVVKINSEMSEVAQSTIPGVPKLVKKRFANPYLWRDYKIRAEELQMDVEVKMLDDPDAKKPHGHHHHHHHHDHSHHHHNHDHHDHSHEHKEMPKVEEVKPETPSTPPPKPVEQKLIDPLKKISLDAIKGVQKELPKPEAVTPEPKPAEIPNTPPIDNKIVETEPDKLAPVVEKASELKEEVKKIAPDMINSIIDAVEQIAAQHPDPKVDPVASNIEEKIAIPKEEATIPNQVTTPAPAAEIPKVEVPEEKPVDSLPTTASPLDIPAPPPHPVEELKLPPLPEIPNVAPIVDAPTTPSPVAELPTTLPTPIDPIEIPTTTPIPAEIPVTATPVTVEEPTTPVPVEIPPPTTTPIPVEIPATTEATTTTTSAPQEFTEPPPGPPLSVLQEEVRDRRAVIGEPKDEDTEYCFKNDCSGGDAPVTSGFVATTIRPVIKSFSTGFRSFMPYPLSDFDDTGAFVFVFFTVSFIVYIFSWLFSDSGRPDVLDRRALHDALTKIKEQEVQIDKLKKNVSDPAVIDRYNQAIEQLRKEKADAESKLHSAVQALRQRDAELQELRQDQSQLQAENHKLTAEKAELQNKVDNLTAETKALHEDQELLRSQLDEANNRQADTISQLQDYRKQIDELESHVNELESAKSSLQIDLDSEISKSSNFEEKYENLKREQEHYIVLMGELEQEVAKAQAAAQHSPGKDVASSGGSNASNGWSDMDIDLEATEEVKEEEPVAAKVTKAGKPIKVASLGKKTKEKEASPEAERKISVTEKPGVTGLMQVVSVRAELEKVKGERDDLKRELANEQKNREVIEQNLETLKKTLNEKKADLEQATKDKDYFRTQSEMLNQKNTEYTNKIERLQEDREKYFEAEKQILVLEAQKRDAEQRVKDLEKQVRKLEDTNAQLETRRYTEEREYKAAIRKLDEQIASIRVKNMALETAGSGNSSDRDFVIAPHEPTGLQSLWSDLDGPETSFDDSPLEPRRESRRSIREPPMESGRRSVGRREGQGSTHRRYRSRSAGRQRQSGAPSPYLGSGLPPPSHGSSRASPTNYYESIDRAELRRSTGRLSRSGNQGYYSSDGSGPLSPPPQLAARSGVPPDGVSRVKPSIQLHRPAPK